MARRTTTVLSAIAMLAAAPLVAAQRADGPDQSQQAQILDSWRDMRPDLADLRAQIEGSAPPSIEGLTHWLGTDARSWEDLRGKVVLLDAWATWCPPCRAAIPKLTEMHEKYKGDGLVILGVHSARGWERQEEFVQQNDMPWFFAADTERSLYEPLGIRIIPSYFFIDRSGVMRVAYANRNHLEDIARVLLAEPAPEDAPAPATSVAHGDYPEFVSKELYARDVRGERAPRLEVEEWLTDRPDTQGRVVMIDLWATWCPPCRTLIPKLNAMQDRFRDDMVIIGLSDEAASTVRTFLESNETTYAQAIDTQGRLKKAIEVRGIPHVLIIGTDGVVRWQGFPGSREDPLTDEVISRIIEADPGVAARRAAEHEQRQTARGG